MSNINLPSSLKNTPRNKKYFVEHVEHNLILFCISVDITKPNDY